MTTNYTRDEKTIKYTEMIFPFARPEDRFDHTPLQFAISWYTIEKQIAISFVFGQNKIATEVFHVQEKNIR